MEGPGGCVRKSMVLRYIIWMSIKFLGNSLKKYHETCTLLSSNMKTDTALGPPALPLQPVDLPYIL